VRVKDVRWDRGVTEPEGDYAISYGNGNENHALGTRFFVNKGIL
jgi:hypothetical protein